MPFLTTAPAAALRIDGHHRIHEGRGVDHAQGLGEVSPTPGDRGMGEEELVELAFELWGEITRRAAEADLLFDLGHDLGHVGLRIQRF